jgi:hypothetical protein
LQDAERDQRADTPGLAAERRPEGEEEERQEEDLLRPEAVAQPTGGGNPDRQAEQVAGDHPLEGRVVGVEFLAERRQGDVDDRRVEEVHEQPRHEHRRDQPLVVEVLEPGHHGSFAPSSAGYSATATVLIEASVFRAAGRPTSACGGETGLKE